MQAVAVMARARRSNARQADALRGHGWKVLMLIRELRRRLLDGLVIPAHPLALDAKRRFDERHQAALTRYYRAAGAGGMAVGVHTTQFAIRDPHIGLFEPVLSLAADVAREDSNRPPAPRAGRRHLRRRPSRRCAKPNSPSRLGYDAGLLSLGALREAPHDAARRPLPHNRRRSFPSSVSICSRRSGGLAARLRLLARVPRDRAESWQSRWRHSTGTRRSTSCRALADSGRQDEVALYTGNDDNIVADLLADHVVSGIAGQRDGSILLVACSASGLSGRGARWRLLADIQGMPGASAPCGYVQASCASGRRSPTPTPHCSTHRTRSPAASPACTKFFAGKDCWRAAGASIRTRTFPRANSKEIERVCQRLSAPAGRRVSSPRI